MLRIIFLSLLATTFFVDAHSKKVDKPFPQIFYINIPVQEGDKQWQLSAQYRLPKDREGQKAPAVLIIHSSSGVDSTGAYYAKALNRMGIATLEIDLWGARGMQGGSGDRPGLPQETLPDTFAAFKYLAEQEEIDVNRIGIMGFSWGGVLSLLTATENYMATAGYEYRFAGHVAHYPVCWVYNFLPGFDIENLTGAPVLIQTGEFDDYDLPESCPSMAANLPDADKELVTVKVYRNAFHAWDRLEPEWVVEDPFSHLGQGGTVILSPNRKIAQKSRRKVVNFFEKIFFND
jgi:dienelactone hydrolase